MREYILTEKERTIIKRYLQTGERLEGYAVIRNRSYNTTTIKEDLELITQFQNTKR